MAEEKSPLKWKFETGIIIASPAVSDGVAYFCIKYLKEDRYWPDSHLYAVDSKTGKEKWKFETEDNAPVYSFPLVQEGLVMFGSDGFPFLYAVDTETGRIEWKFETENTVETTPVLSEGVVYFGSSDNHLYAVDSKTGKEKWKFKTGGWVYSSPAVSDGVVYFGSNDNHLYAVDIDIAQRLAPEQKIKEKEADKHGITVEDIRTKYISGEITLEEAIELQSQHLKEEQKEKELEQKRKEEEQRIEKQKAEEETPTEENILHNIDCKVTLETYSPCTIIEKAAGTVDISEIVNAISSGESIEDKWYDYNDIRHVYGTTDIADTVNFSDSDIQDKWDEDGYLDISADADADDFDIDNLEKGDYKYLLSSPTFILTAESYEKGKWNTYSIDIKGEFDPELIKPYCSGELICGYEYDGMEMDSNQDMESTTSNTDISIYLITKDGIELADFDEIRNNMTEKGLDSENGDDIRRYLKDEYGVE